MEVIRAGWLISAIVGGPRRHLSLILPKLCTLGYKPVVFTSTQDRESGHGLLRSLGIEVVTIPGLDSFVGQYRVALRYLVQEFRSRHLDLLTTMSLQTDLIGTLAARVARVPVVVSHAPAVPVPDFRPYRLAKLFFYKPAYAVTRPLRQAVVCVSQATAEILHASWGNPKEKLWVISGGLDSSFELKNSWPIRLERNDRPVWRIGFMGNLHPVKGVHVLLEAVSVIARSIDSVEFLIAGDGLERERLLGMSQQLGLSRKARFLGFITDVPGFLNSLDILVFPSLTREGMPYSVLEGLATGTPVVATAVGGVPEIVKDRQTGLLVRPGDSVQLAEAVAELIRSPLMAQAIALQGRALIEEYYTVDREAADYDRLYRRLLGEAERSGRV